MERRRGRMGNEGGRGEKSILAEIILFLAKSIMYTKMAIIRGWRVLSAL